MELKNPSPGALAIVISTATVTLIVALGIFSSSHGSHRRSIAKHDKDDKDAKNAKNDDRGITENDTTKTTWRSSIYEARSDYWHGKEEDAKFHAFLTHNWGKDVHNRDNHERVIRFKNELEKCGIDQTWLDEERMTGHLVQQMCDGIDRSTFVIVFVTRSYIDKVNGKGPKRCKDNCKLEFGYAAGRKEASKLIAVVMEDGCSDSSEWEGPVGMQLGGHLYFLYTKDSELQDCAKKVSETILSGIPRKRLRCRLQG